MTGRREREQFSRSLVIVELRPLALSISSEYPDGWNWFGGQIVQGTYY